MAHHRQSFVVDRQVAVEIAAQSSLRLCNIRFLHKYLLLQVVMKGKAPWPRQRLSRAGGPDGRVHDAVVDVASVAVVRGAA